jgi:hypothetical protein
LVVSADATCVVSPVDVSPDAVVVVVVASEVCDEFAPLVSVVITGEVTGAPFWLAVVSLPAEMDVVDALPTATVLLDVEVDEACVVSSAPPPPPPHALTSALAVSAIVVPRSVSKKLKAIGSAEVEKGRSQSSSTANPEDTCCDTRSIGRAGEVSE